jgi:hypothetical protein
MVKTCQPIRRQYGLKTQTIISVNQVRNVNAIKPGDPEDS